MSKARDLLRRMTEQGLGDTDFDDDPYYDEEEEIEMEDPDEYIEEE